MCEEVVIVVPVYKDILNELEEISLNQLKKILGEYKIIFVMPEGMQVTYTDSNDKKYFPQHFFLSTDSYSRLLLMEDFYKCFLNYNYMLIYQLDAFVFKNQLEYFCDLGYDYIGAPWLSGMTKYFDNKYVASYVGNGGFSLRNIKSCIRLIRNKEFLLREYSENEDIFFSNGDSNDFKVAPLDIALKFSFESEVLACYKRNGYQIPFGCHAWEKYNLKFWKPYMEEFGYQLDMKYIYKGNGDDLKKLDYEKQKRVSFFLQYVYDRKFFKQMMDSKQKVFYLWGAGFIGQSIGRLLDGAEIEYIGYFDNNASLLHSKINEKYVLSINEMRRNEGNAYIIITMDAHRLEVAEQLQFMGYRYEIDYIFYEDLFEELKSYTKKVKKDSYS